MAARLRYALFLFVVALGALAIALHFAARGEARRLAAALAPHADLQYEDSGFTWNGGMRLDAPRLEIREGPWRGVLQARVATLRSGNWWWMIARAAGGATDLPDEGRIDIRGLTVPATAAASVVEQWLRPPGVALFEMQGCPGGPIGIPERERMRVHAGERIDRIDYRFDAAAGELEVGFALEQAGIAAVRGSFELAAVVPRAADFPADVRLDRGEVDYVDSGYLAARNMLCAQRLETDPAQFLDRHMAAVDALLAAHGIRLGEGVRAVYRRLVADGGTLKFTVFPDAGWRPARWAETARGDLLRELNMTARHGDAPPVMLQLVFDHPGEPLRVATLGNAIVESAPTVAVDEASGDGTTRAAAPAHVASPIVDLGAPPLISAAQAAPPPVTGTVAAPTPPAPVASEPMRPTREPAIIAGRSGDTAAAEPQDPTAGLGASAPPPPENSVLALVWKPGVIERVEARPAPERDYTVIATTALAGQRGRRVRLLTVGGKLVDGELRGVEAGQAQVRVRVAGGRADVSVALANIREARLVVGGR